MPTSPLMLFLLQILVWLENPVVVWTLVVIVIGIRYLWVRTHPRPAMAKTTAAPSGAPVKPKRDPMVEVIDTVLIALILVFGIVRPFLLQTFFIPSGSMIPTLEIRDRLIADKFIYFFRPPMRGEVVVFSPPDSAYAGQRPDLQLRWWLETHPGTLSPEELRVISSGLGLSEKQRSELAQVPLDQLESALLQILPEIPVQRDDYIKRVIGVPGDHIRIQANVGVFINGEKLPERYLPRYSPISAINFPEPEFYALTPYKVRNEYDVSPFFEWLHNRFLTFEYITPNVVKAPGGKYEFVVPEKSIFVMGDNRLGDGSFDSRFWGVVPYNRVKARAISTFWPLNRLKLL